MANDLNVAGCSSTSRDGHTALTWCSESSKLARGCHESRLAPLLNDPFHRGEIPCTDCGRVFRPCPLREEEFQQDWFSRRRRRPDCGDDNRDWPLVNVEVSLRGQEGDNGIKANLSVIPPLTARMRLCFFQDVLQDGTRGRPIRLIGDRDSSAR